MANIGHFIDRSPSLRAAGVETRLDESNANDCLRFGTTEEQSQYWINAECKRNMKLNAEPLFKRTPCFNEGHVKDLLTTDVAKSRFVAFKEKFSEDLYFKKAKLGEVKETNSIPEGVTNLSQTFGVKNKYSDSLYEIVLPPKTAADVNTEYGSFHDKYIISHNHYFPSEQINRKYDKPFDRRSTFGILYNVDDNGSFVKRCLQHCDQLILVSKTQMDFIDRTNGPLGRKYKKYPYEVPDITHGIKIPPERCNAKMVIENIDPCKDNSAIIAAFAHLHKVRRKIHEMQDFHVHDLEAVLETLDTDNTKELPLARIFQPMARLNVHVDHEKFHAVLERLNLLIDANCPTERVNYEKFCRLLMSQVALPNIGTFSDMPKEVHNKETTYRVLCEDRHKPVPPDRPTIIKSLTKFDDKNCHAGDLVAPTIATKLGLGLSDFLQLRSKDALERIFQKIVSPENFEIIWTECLSKYPQQNEQISVTQFRDILNELKLSMI